MNKEGRFILPVIVISQFCCTSLWFAGNGVMNELAETFRLTGSALSHLTSSVQFGFICGTLVFAVLTIADRFAPPKVFFISAIAGSVFNAGMIYSGNSFASLLTFRFLTGFFLAGIYPVGMKIASDHFKEGLGKSLGYLVGALVLGTAFPHFARAFLGGFPWRGVIMSTSLLAILGGTIIFVTMGRTEKLVTQQKPDFGAWFRVFDDRQFRSAALGYFGHMWELYTFWAFVPVMLAAANALHPEMGIDISLSSFVIIGVGALACVSSGYISQNAGPRRTAFVALLLSGICCLVSPLVFQSGSKFLLIGFLIFWSWNAIADSPMFSTLVAQNAKPEWKGTALTIVTCIGFAITIVSIQLMGVLVGTFNPVYCYAVLGIGPVLGLVAMNLGKKSV